MTTIQTLHQSPVEALTIQTLLQNPVEALAVAFLVPAIPLVIALLIVLACMRAPPRREFVPWADAEATAAAEPGSVLVLDSTHGALPCLTHHRTAAAKPRDVRGDTSTDLVFAARRARHAPLRRARFVTVRERARTRGRARSRRSPLERLSLSLSSSPPRRAVRPL